MGSADQAMILLPVLYMIWIIAPIILMYQGFEGI